MTTVQPKIEGVTAKPFYADNQAEALNYAVAKTIATRQSYYVVPLSNGTFLTILSGAFIDEADRPADKSIGTGHPDWWLVTGIRESDGAVIVQGVAGEENQLPGVTFTTHCPDCLAGTH